MMVLCQMMLKLGLQNLHNHFMMVLRQMTLKQGLQNLHNHWALHAHTGFGNTRSDGGSGGTELFNLILN